ncbi:hypothetical protein J2T13_000553 [Paenibacillus sp. DS2015]|uniref:hypothetical protein n=1 Tax=Paenibacillus sp. DS2015 TaxID=3373917 RepID=UPI003D1BF5BE
MEKIDPQKLCHDHIHRYVRVWLIDGRNYDGFVESVDDEQLYLAVPVCHEVPQSGQMGAENAGHQVGWNDHHGNYGGYPGIQTRALSQGYYASAVSDPSDPSRSYPVFPGYGYPGYGYGGYGYPPYGRRFNRLILPLAALAALSLLPYY